MAIVLRPVPLSEDSAAPELEINAGDTVLGKTHFRDLLSGDDNSDALNCLSRRHVLIESESSGLWLTDLGSTNGTVLNNKVIPADSRCALKNGDVITIGHEFFTYNVCVGSELPNTLTSSLEGDSSDQPQLSGEGNLNRVLEKPDLAIESEKPSNSAKLLSGTASAQEDGNPSSVAQLSGKKVGVEKQQVDNSSALDTATKENNQPASLSTDASLSEPKAIEESESTGSDTRMFNAGMSSLGQALSSEKSNVNKFGDDLLDAVSIVAANDDMEIVRPGAGDFGVGSESLVEPICRASGIRYRNVLLSADRWWESDCGPMLGFLKENDQPVALIQNKSNRYQITNSENQHVAELSSESAQLLDLRAIRFYRPLPEDFTSVWQIPRWALKKNTKDLIGLGILSLFVTLIGMLIPQATALLIDNAIPGANRGLVVELGFGLVLAAVGTALFSFSQGILTVRLGIVSDSASQSAVWDRLLRLKISIFKKYSQGDLLDRAMGVSAVNRELNGQTMRSILTGFTSLLNLALLYWYNATLASWVLFIGLLIAVFTVIGGSFVRKYYRALMDIRGAFFGFVVELVNASSKIRVAGAQRRAFAKWSEKYSQQLDLTLKAAAIEDILIVFNASVPLISSIVIYWLAAGLLYSEEGEALSVGVFLAFNVAMGTFLGGVTFLSNTALELMDTIAKANRAKPLLLAPIEDSEESVDPGVLQGRIAFNNVDFRYSVDTPYIFRDLSFAIDPGEFVAFVGSSGSGKSTIFRLILGFEEPEDGRVTIDGQELFSMRSSSVRRQLGVVLQDARIGSGPLIESIGAGVKVSVEEAWAAARDAGFDRDIEDMPMGMHTVISEGGTNLSGGQRQRLMIARALVRNPRILLFDEATSALDNRTQAIVSESLNRRKVTRLVIAHRLSTIKEADKVFVIDKGSIAQSGTFEELQSQEGIFRTMMKRQELSGA